jgi:FKBP-type peptidyl-prolyl cis-trans isomerase 2
MFFGVDCMPVKNGDKIKVEYEGKLDDGTIFDSTDKHGEPLEFEVGSGQIIPGFDTAVIGMEKDEEKEVKLEPCDAYGEPKPELIKQVPKEQLPQDEELKVGMMLMLTLPNGMQLAAIISEVGDENITLDLNHPLAGKTLNFKIKIIEIAS